MLLGLKTRFFMMLEARNIFASGLLRSWSKETGMQMSLGATALNESRSPALGLWSWTPVLRFSAFLGMDDVHFLIPSWRNSLCGVQTGLRQIHITLWSTLKEEARATTFNLLLSQYKLGYLHLHLHSFFKDNLHQMRSISLCSGISFIAFTLVNSTSPFGDLAHVSPCCKKLTQSGNCVPVNHVRNYPCFLGMMVKRQRLWQTFWKDNFAFCKPKCASFCISAEAL